MPAKREPTKRVAELENDRQNLSFKSNPASVAAPLLHINSPVPFASDLLSARLPS